MRLITIILMTTMLLGCTTHQRDNLHLNDIPDIKNYDHLILNPDAKTKIIFVTGLIDQWDPGLEGVYYNYKQEMWIDVRVEGKQHANVAVTVHEWAHHLEFVAEEYNWSHEERLKLSKLIIKCLRDVNDPKNGFETVSHETWLHYYKPSNDFETNWKMYYEDIIVDDGGDEDMELLTPEEIEDLLYRDWLERQEESLIEE